MTERMMYEFIKEAMSDNSEVVEFCDKKIAALKCHESEYNKFGGEDWVEGVRCRCGFRGYEIGKKYAEAFEILRLEMSFDESTSL